MLPFRWHDMRHCYVSMLIAAGMDVLYLGGLGGHSSGRRVLGAAWQALAAVLERCAGLALDPAAG